VQLDLLNWLAATFMEKGWSLKALHRVILLSNTYQQAGELKARYANLDPENLLLHRFNRQRLDFEAMRDTLLTASGKIDLTLGGLPVDLTKEPFSGRRTVYGFIDRQNLPAMFRTFDFANPDSSSPGRFATTVPQQALFMMNSPFVAEQARTLVNRPEVKNAANDAARVKAIYQLLYQRDPDADELKLAVTFAERNAAMQPKQAITPGWQYGYGWFDPLVNRAKDFKRINQPKDKRYSPGAAYPDKQFGHLSITPNGGHTGPTPQLGSVRRWVAPADGFIRIKATLAHGSKNGDGVRGRIVSSRGGKLGEWTVLNNKVATNLDKLEVKLGETVDFVVECGKESSFDSYTWAPVITLIGDYDVNLSKRSWNAEKDFGTKEKTVAPLGSLEKFAQVLLLSNEMAFVD
jgi:hypothetical protein